MRKLVKKYDRPAPRYTSYPPVPFWKEVPSPDDWVEELRERIQTDPRVDLYLHIPFCEELCYYCGCNRTITKDKSKGDAYAELLLTEWRLYRERLGDRMRIHSIHFGGGTPTFLGPEVLENILQRLRPSFDNDFIGNIEIDPRTCTVEHLQVLKKYGFKRISLGIQDFDEKVQAKIHRLQSFRLVKSLVQTIRSIGFESINFDLIYGLPGQTATTVAQTIELVRELAPDTIAFYSYAHLPERIKNQRLIKEVDLPSPEEKLELYLLGQDQLTQAGYLHVGMDHFAKTGSFLSGPITRSFMGYTDRKTNVLIGLGASAIGQTPSMFIQNEKDVKTYEERVGLGVFPLVHGHRLSSKEKEIALWMQDLFCQGEVTFPPHFGERFEDEEQLIELERDGLIVWKDHQRLIVTPLGKNFLRNIAVAIDPLLRVSAPVRFSQTV